MKKFLEEFKSFAMRGNVLDLAVAVIMGTAFGAVVTSFVNDVLMAAIAAVFQQPDFSMITVGAIRIGKFLNATINFLLVAFAVFCVVKVANAFKKEEPVVEKEPVVNEELETLKAILAELKNK